MTERTQLMRKRALPNPKPPNLEDPPALPCTSRRQKTSHFLSQDSQSAVDKKQAAFPFLSLPPEIRVQIMKYYFGSNTVHVTKEINQRWGYVHWSDRSNHRGPLDHRMCIADSEFARKHRYENHRDLMVEENSLESDDEDEEASLYSYRERKQASLPYIILHEQCSEDHAPDIALRFPGPLQGQRFSNVEIVETALLYSSKQIYLEATEVLYSTQTFSFLNPNTFQDFCVGTTLSQQRSLRSVELYTRSSIRRNDRGLVSIIDEWHFSDEMMKALEYVTDLKLWMEPYVATTSEGKFRQPYEVAETLHLALREEFGPLRMLENLRNVTVRIDDQVGTRQTLDPERTDAVTNKFRDELLSPSGKDAIEAEETERGWHKERHDLAETMHRNEYLLASLPKALKSLTTRYNKKTRIIKMRLYGDKNAEARLKELDYVRDHMLYNHRGTSRSYNLQQLEEEVAAAKAFDKSAVMSEIQILKEKITTYWNNVFRYIEVVCEEDTQRDA